MMSRSSYDCEERPSLLVSQLMRRHDRLCMEALCHEYTTKSVHKLEHEMCLGSMMSINVYSLLSAMSIELLQTPVQLSSSIHPVSFILY